jgi:hypothetical protein
MEAKTAQAAPTHRKATEVTLGTCPTRQTRHARSESIAPMFQRTAVSLLCLAAIGATATPQALAAKRVTTTKPTATKVAHPTAAKMQGGSTGDGPASDDDCQRIADVIQNRLTMASQDFAAGPGHDSEGLDLLDEALKYEDQGYAAGCFFVY